MKHSFVRDEDKTILKLFGEIKEKTSFPDITEMVSGDKLFYIDLEGISSINSLGIKNWLDWVGSIQNIKNVVFMEVPSCIILQMDMVENFLPRGASISSFMVPYFCGSCDLEINVKFNNHEDVNVKDGKVVVRKKVTTLCKEGGCDIEEDLHTIKYFKFLLN